MAEAGEFQEKFKKEIKIAKKLLEDKESKKIFEEIIEKNKKIFNITQLAKYEEYSHPKVHVEKNDFVIDAGISSEEDQTERFLEQTGNGGFVLGFEPENYNYTELMKKFNTLQIPNVKIENLGLWDEKTMLSITQNGKMSSVCEPTNTKTNEAAQLITLDEYVKEKNIKKIDFIKMDVEGAERKALNGAAETIKRFRPKLAISVYHRRLDIFYFIFKIHSLKCGYKLFLGHHIDNANSHSIILYAYCK